MVLRSHWQFLGEKGKDFGVQTYEIVPNGTPQKSDLEARFGIKPLRVLLL
jgi:hypothetical protein